MTWLSVIFPLQAVAPISCAYWVWRILRGLRLVRSPAPRQLPVGFAKQTKFFAIEVVRKLASFWFGVEACFLIFFLYKRRRLDAQPARPPQIPLGSAVPILRRVFQATEDIQAGGKMIEPGSRPSTASAIHTKNQLTRDSSVQDLQHSLHLKSNESNVEELLRGWDSLQRDAAPADASIVLNQHNISDHDRRTMELMMDDAEMFALKQAEVSGWFVQRCKGSAERWPSSRIGELRRGNVEEFMAWAFYHCRPKEVPAEREEEWEQLLAEGSKWVGIDFVPGYNEDAQPMRVTMDRIVASHRPFLFYAVTALVLPALTGRILGRLGFAEYSSGTLAYWHRTADTRSSSPPIVFIHGLGLNILPYYYFIYELLQVASGRTIFLVSLPHISMRLQEHVPSCAEMVACLSDMLSSWGYKNAHFIGHSFGTLPLAWMVRLAPSQVSMATFLDPVCFLIIKPDVCYNFIYRRPETPAQMLTQFFAARELYIANSLSRNFFWFNNLLWPEDLSMPSLVALSGRDAIVPAHSVRRYLAVYKQRHGLDSLKLLWFPDHSHGEFCLPGQNDACCSIIRDMLLMDSLYSSPVRRATGICQGA